MKTKSPKSMTVDKIFHQLQPASYLYTLLTEEDRFLYRRRLWWLLSIRGSCRSLKCTKTGDAPSLKTLRGTLLADWGTRFEEFIDMFSPLRMIEPWTFKSLKVPESVLILLYVGSALAPSKTCKSLRSMSPDWSVDYSAISIWKFQWDYTNIGLRNLYKKPIVEA